MIEQNPFKWRHFQADIILLCVRWYLRYVYAVDTSSPGQIEHPGTVFLGRAERPHALLPLLQRTQAMFRSRLFLDLLNIALK